MSDETPEGGLVRLVTVNGRIFQAASDDPETLLDEIPMMMHEGAWLQCDDGALLNLRHVVDAKHVATETVVWVDQLPTGEAEPS